MSKSTIEYWLEDENIETTSFSAKPVIGEIIHINNKMDSEWYDARFPNRKLFRPGVSGDFQVISVKRYISTFDITIDETINNKTYSLPGQDIREVFEVFVKKVK